MLPIAPIARTDKELAKWQKSSTDVDEPNRIWLRIDAEDASLPTDLSDSVLPAHPAARSESVLPIAPIARTDKELAR